MMFLPGLLYYLYQMQRVSSMRPESHEALLQQSLHNGVSTGNIKVGDCVFIDGFGPAKIVKDCKVEKCQFKKKAYMIEYPDGTFFHIKTAQVTRVLTDEEIDDRSTCRQKPVGNPLGPPRVELQADTNPKPLESPRVELQADTNPSPLESPRVELQADTNPKPLGSPRVELQADTNPEPLEPPGVEFQADTIPAPQAVAECDVRTTCCNAKCCVCDQSHEHPKHPVVWSCTGSCSVCGRLFQTGIQEQNKFEVQTEGYRGGEMSLQEMAELGARLEFKGHDACNQEHPER
eukprot:TRINITY_DN4051_c0_g1_i1.p1 TRINITY_DN4051_c0_g1~~TRINITY_DN4051_c0_g1_i1.p1  ORF type:complete len:290 (-),score=40.94 TRINITY_DN4051_c0_g1_i1:49-918(-)